MHVVAAKSAVSQSTLSGIPAITPDPYWSRANIVERSRSRLHEHKAGACPVGQQSSSNFNFGLFISRFSVAESAALLT